MRHSAGAGAFVPTRQVVAEPTSIASNLRMGWTSLLLPICHSASGGRAPGPRADGSPPANRTPPQRPSPGPARRGASSGTSTPWPVERPGRVLTAPRRATGPRRLPRVRHDATCLRAHAIRPVPGRAVVVVAEPTWTAFSLRLCTYWHARDGCGRTGMLPGGFPSRWRRRAAGDPLDHPVRCAEQERTDFRPAKRSVSRRGS